MHRCGHHRPRLAEYRPSALELEWFEKPAVGKICDLMLQQRAGSSTWLNFSETLWRQADPSMTLRGPTEAEKSVLSQFIYEDGSVEYVEPLTGYARYPNGPIGCKGSDKHARYKNHTRFQELFNIRYIVPSSTCGLTGDPRVGCYRKARFYDLGCTTYSGTHREALRALPTQASGLNVGGPSIPLFSEIYRRRCLPFDELYGWEASKAARFESSSWYRDVPSDVRPRIHYYNTPVALANNGTDDTIKSALSIDAADWEQRANAGDFFGTLLASASPEDFVVVKLDIEGQSGGPEVAIAEAIAMRPELVRLVDEFYFEYHFWFDGHNFGWGNVKKEGSPNVDDALDLMRRLRKAGVRAHFWI